MQTPMALLPEFSDSREEPNGPVRLDAADVVTIFRPRGTYLLALQALGTAWEKRHCAAFVVAYWRNLAFVPPFGEDGDR